MHTEGNAYLLHKARHLRLLAGLPLPFLSLQQAPSAFRYTSICIFFTFCLSVYCRRWNQILDSTLTHLVHLSLYHCTHWMLEASGKLKSNSSCCLCFLGPSNTKLLRQHCLNRQARSSKRLHQTSFAAALCTERNQHGSASSWRTHTPEASKGECNEAECWTT